MSPDSVLQVEQTEPPRETEEAPSLADRNIRHRDIMKPEVLSKVQAIVVGVGAIGRQLALQLAAVGVPKIWIMDPDTVAVENLAAQGFLEADLEKSKVDAVSEMCALINSSIEIRCSKTKFRKEFVADLKREEEEDETRFVVFSCVDDMGARRAIWNTFSARFLPADEEDPRALFLDARMGAEAARALVVSSRDGKDYYPRTLFDARDGLQQSCTAKTTIYCANIAAAMLMGQFSKWLRGMLPDKDTLYNIFAAELIHDSEEIV